MGFLEKVKAFVQYFDLVFKKKTRDANNTVTDALSAGRDFCKCHRCGSHYSLRKLFLPSTSGVQSAYLCKECYDNTYFAQMDKNGNNPLTRRVYYGTTRKLRREAERRTAKRQAQRAKVALVSE